MILRKPYAFLIRNFRKINILLFLCTIYVFYKSLNIANITENYVAYGDTGILQEIIDSFTSSYFFILFVVLVITAILIFLLHRKEKPIKTYVITFITYLVIFIFGFIARNYYQDVVIEGFDKAIARTMNGFAFVLTLPQYGILLLLLIRSIGIDLKSFGFRQDKELLASEEDREEVEVEFEFNKDKWMRNFNRLKRNTKYFLKQNKFYVSIAVIVLLAIGGYSTYRYFYVTNRVYAIGESLSSNYYTFKVNNAYITDRDYKGDVLKRGKSYVIIDIDVTNDLSAERTLDIDKFILTIDDKVYTPSVNYNEYFKDLGPVFNKQSIAGYKTDNYFLIFEIDTPNEKSSVLLRYQDVTTNSKLIRIKVQLRDISSFVVRDTKNLSEEMPIQINLKESVKLKIASYEFGESYNYLYEVCYASNCPVYQGTINSNINSVILSLRVTPIDKTAMEMLQFVLKYGKVKYKIGDLEYLASLVSSINRIYKGNYIYFTVPREASVSETVELVFTIRNNQYIYKLK